MDSEPVQDLIELAKCILIRWDMEPQGAIFPCCAVREDLRKALDAVLKNEHSV